MPDVRDHLAEIRGRCDAVRKYAQIYTTSSDAVKLAHADVPRLVAALERVLAECEKVPKVAASDCDDCWGDGFWLDSQGERIDCPCLTLLPVVARIEAAIRAGLEDGDG